MTDAVPTIKLAGRDWEIPVLSIKQNRVVIPNFLKFMPAFARISLAVAEKDTNPLWWATLDLSTEDMDRMCDALYAALTKKYPGMARNEFDNMEASLEEIFQALPVIAKQTGILKERTVTETAEVAAAGEAPAAGGSTSISSSPITAPEPANPGPTN